MYSLYRNEGSGLLDVDQQLAMMNELATILLLLYIVESLMVITACGLLTKACACDKCFYETGRAVEKH